MLLESVCEFALVLALAMYIKRKCVIGVWRFEIEKW